MEKTEHDMRGKAQALVFCLELRHAVNDGGCRLFGAIEALCYSSMRTRQVHHFARELTRANGQCMVLSVLGRGGEGRCRAYNFMYWYRMGEVMICIHDPALSVPRTISLLITGRGGWASAAHPGRLAAPPYPVNCGNGYREMAS